ncbi:hypothetical protein B0I35DRAFT_432720 [Stachybotrys elegans]|uniref:Uncharacterized protein n=1 Tax=Stachybotrys elegans TaxID=80388 RepID=A0A8K0WSM8_9HYPO|nr:hypothetical protein B0I35DRAFT_432720 [Stachybotrys elegans]
MRGSKVACMYVCRSCLASPPPPLFYRLDSYNTLWWYTGLPYCQRTDLQDVQDATCNSLRPPGEVIRGVTI